MHHTKGLLHQFASSGSTAANSVLPGSGIVIGILLNYAIDEYGDDIYNSVVDGYNTLVL